MTEVTQEDREAFKAFRELLFKPRVGEDGFCLMDIEAGLQWVASHRIAAIEATKEACAKALTDAARNAHENGYQRQAEGIRDGVEFVRALTATDIMKGVGR